jgi:hypothetical protein
MKGVMTGMPLRSPVMLAAALVIAASTGVSAQTGRSPDLAGKLASLMAARHLDAFAAKDPDAADRFVAVLFMPQVQLLLVSAQYPVPGELEAQLAQGNYRDVYTALHQPAAQRTRFFFMDGGCDGLRPGADSVDVLYEKGTTQTLFDGHWKNQGITEAVYSKRAEDAETRYVRLLSVLTTALEAQPSSATVQ